MTHAPVDNPTGFEDHDTKTLMLVLRNTRDSAFNAIEAQRLDTPDKSTASEAFSLSLGLMLGVEATLTSRGVAIHHPAFGRDPLFRTV